MEPDGDFKNALDQRVNMLYQMREAALNSQLSQLTDEAKDEQWELDGFVQMSHDRWMIANLASLQLAIEGLMEMAQARPKGDGSRIITL